MNIENSEGRNVAVNMRNCDMVIIVYRSDNSCNIHFEMVDDTTYITKKFEDTDKAINWLIENEYNGKVYYQKYGVDKLGIGVY